jgi:hypothetical protein
MSIEKGCVRLVVRGTEGGGEEGEGEGGVRGAGVGRCYWVDGRETLKQLYDGGQYVNWERVGGKGWCVMWLVPSSEQAPFILVTPHDG